MIIRTGLSASREHVVPLTRARPPAGPGMG